jgi:membrane-bound inhibitor of C-type lysozyme
MQKIFPSIVLIVVALAFVSALVYFSEGGQEHGKDFQGPPPVTTALYTCAEGKTIVATYYNGEPHPSSDPTMPPVPGGEVALALSDGRQMTLSQTISADGARFANADESFIFWSKGDGAFVMEDDTQTYHDCNVDMPALPM